MIKQRFREGRKSPRSKTSRSAELIVGADERSIPCLICDISNDGARLGVARQKANLPHTFVLALFSDRSVLRDCEVVWTNRAYVGVKFVSKWYGATKSLKPRYDKVEEKR